MLRIAIICLLLFVWGCAAQPPKGQSSSRPTTGPSPQDTIDREIQKIVHAADPPPLLRPTVNLTIWHLIVPAGTVSRNDEFWKRVDEQAVDVLTYDLLYKNGLRIGKAPLASIDYFKTLLERHPLQSEPIIFVAAGTKMIELPMKRDVPSQILYDFDAANTLTVRSYDRSENILCIDFQPAPRKNGDIRVAICPMVRAMRKRLVLIGDVETGEVEYVSPERYFNLSLRTEIPLDSLLIVAPSPEASAKMSLGQAFLMHDANAEQMEHILLLLPQAIKPSIPETPTSIPNPE